MEEFTKHCDDMRPNITYLAIGCAYSQMGGAQQHPPFLEKLLQTNPKFSFQIIILDPQIEDLPEASKYFRLNKIDETWYGKDNLNLHVFKENFVFDQLVNSNNLDPNSENIYDDISSYWGDDDSSNGFRLIATNDSVPYTNRSTVSTNPSKEFLLQLINRTINAKKDNPQNTYLFFMHDFSGHNIKKFSDDIWKIYGKLSDDVKNIYQKNILIDLSNGVNNGCFVDINSVYFHPILLKTINDSFEIFNPFLLDNFDVYSILLQKYKNPAFKMLVMQMINYNLNTFYSEIVTIYRQIRMILEKNSNISLNVQDIPKELLIDIDINEVHMALLTKEDNDDWVVKKMTENMMIEMSSFTGFMQFFKKNNIRNELFSEFIEICKQKEIIDHYQITQIYKNCQDKLNIFVYSVNTADYLSELTTHSVQFTIKHKKMPLYMELYLLDSMPNIIETCKKQITVNNTSVIVDL